ncbi:hypothetical protein Aperf_G00000106208 [Anoplocephala perfoliata]
MEEDGDKPKDWTHTRQWVNDIDRSIENLSNSIRGVLKENAKGEKERVLFEHTLTRDCPDYDRGTVVFQHSSLKDNMADGEIDRLKTELQKTRDELHQAETRQATLEALKSHLQLQLRQSSAQCERIVVQMRNSESKTRQTVIQLTQQLADADSRIQELSRQRDLLKHAAKGQKKRALKAEAEIARLRDGNGRTEGEQDKRDGENTSKAITFLEEDNKRLRELAESYEERLAITEKEVAGLQQRLAQTETRFNTLGEPIKISAENSRSVSPTKMKVENGDDLPAPPPLTADNTSQMELTIRDLREKLAQSEALNRNLQSYLSFLKRSYSSIFEGDEVGETKGTPGVVVTMATHGPSVTPEISTSNGASPGLIK